MNTKVNDIKLVHKGRVFKLFTENITLSNGTTIDLDIIKHPGASAIVPVLSDNNLLLIKQYRHAVGGYIWEIPAGTLAENEVPLDCAKRELTEETGFIAGSLYKLGEIIPVPGYSDERIHIFLAYDLVKSTQKLDMDEILDIHKIKFDDAIDMISKGEIKDSKTISGLFMAFKWIKDKSFPS